jgi:hypothetical protein
LLACLHCLLLLACVRALVGPGIIGTGICQGAAWIKRRTAAAYFGGLRHAPYAYTTL